MFHQLCIDIAYATITSSSIIKFHRKQIIIDNDGYIASSSNTVFRLWGTDALFLWFFSPPNSFNVLTILYHHSWSHLMSPNMTISTKMKWFLPKLAVMQLPKLMSKFMIHGYKTGSTASRISVRIVNRTLK